MPGNGPFGRPGGVEGGPPARRGGGAAASSSASHAARARDAAPPGSPASSGLWVYVIDTSAAARSEDVVPNRARYALGTVRSLSKAALSLPHAPDDAAVVVAAAAPRVLVPPGADDGGLLFADPWQLGGATAGDAFELLPALRLALLLCRQRLAGDGCASSRAAAPAAGPPLGGRAVVFINSGVAVRAADADAALAAFAAAPAAVGLDLVLLGGAGAEVDDESVRQLARIVQGLNGGGEEGLGTPSSSGSVGSSGGGGSSGGSSRLGTRFSSSLASSAAASPAPLPFAPVPAAAAATPATPAPTLPAPAPQLPPLVAAAAAPRARLVRFEAPDPDLPAWQQVEPLLELLELPTAHCGDDFELQSQLAGGARDGAPRAPPRRGRRRRGGLRCEQRHGGARGRRGRVRRRLRRGCGGG